MGTINNMNKTMELDIGRQFSTKIYVEWSEFHATTTQVSKLRKLLELITKKINGLPLKDGLCIESRMSQMGMTEEDTDLT